MHRLEKIHFKGGEKMSQETPAALTPDQLAVAFKKLPGWREDNNALVKTFVFPSFTQAITFVGAVAYLAEKQNHHPDIDVRFRKIKLSLSTHDSGGQISERDTKLASAIEQFLA